MLLLGLILIALGALVIIAAVFTVEIVGGVGAEIELIGLEVTPLGLFLIGVASGVAILWGFDIFKWGTKRGLARRREQKKLNELSEKLDRADAERRHDIGDHADEDRPTI
jgi:membrane-bound ClpP family serine protease